MGFLACSFAWSGSGCLCSGAGGSHGAPSLSIAYSVCMAAYSGYGRRGYLLNVLVKVNQCFGESELLNYLPLLEQISHAGPMQTTLLVALQPPLRFL